MPAPSLSRPALALGPGYLYLAALASTEPTPAVTGGVFSDSWPGAWRFLGATEEGHAFNVQTNVEPVEAAEFFFPLQYEPESWEGTVEFSLLSLTATNLKAALNGGTINTTGTGATTLSTYEPPDPGSEIRQMLGWESKDLTEKVIWRQVFQTGQVQLQRRRGGGNKAMLPFSFQVEQPTTGKPFTHWFAGTGRA
jgi:hypothetical protein